jgi:DnaJ-class molecular chaperone
MNYYQILNIDPESSLTEIKKSYRKLSLKFHPDKNPDGSNQFKLINTAYETLSDPDKKKEYDLSLIPHHKPPTSAPTQHQHSHFIQPITKQVQISLEQSYTGVTLEVPLTKWKFMDGHKITEDFVQTVYLQPGVDNNETVILHKSGNELDFVEKGDIKIVVQIQEHPVFKRNDLDLIMEKTITVDEAINGVIFVFTHINGKKYTYQYNKSTIQPETKKIIEGKGMISGDLIGNLEILFHVVLPEKN